MAAPALRTEFRSSLPTWSAVEITVADRRRLAPLVRAITDDLPAVGDLYTAAERLLQSSAFHNFALDLLVSARVAHADNAERLAESARAMEELDELDETEGLQP